MHRLPLCKWGRAGQEKTQVRLPGASKFYSWASENGSLVARWANETSLSSLVSDNSSQKQLKNLRLQDEQNNRQYQVNDVVDNA